MVTKDLGLVTAYAYAVSKGYTGTEEEFAELMASYASVAQDAANAALASAQSAQSAQASAQSAQSAQTAAEGASDTAQATVSGAIAGIQAEGQTQIGAVQSEGTAQVGNVNSAGQTQVGNVNAAGATQVGNVNTAGSTQVSAIQAKGNQIIASLPEDYTEIRGQVSQLSDDIDGIDSDVTDLKSAMSDMDLLSANLCLASGEIKTATYKWGDTNNPKTLHTHFIHKINPGDEIEIHGRTNNANVVIMFLTAYTTPVDGADASLSAISPFNAYITVGQNAVKVFTAPSDAKFLYIFWGTLYDSNFRYPSGLYINGYDVFSSAFRNMSSVIRQKAIKKVSLSWQPGKLSDSGTESNSSSTVAIRNLYATPINASKVTVEIASGYKADAHFYSYYASTNSTHYSTMKKNMTGSNVLDVPLGYNYIRFVLVRSDGGAVPITDGSKLKLTYIDETIGEVVSDYANSGTDFISLAMFETIGVIGDSFASGNIYPGGVNMTKYNVSWPQIIARKNGITVTNYTEGGIYTRTWLSDNDHGLATMLADTAKQLYICALGINDNTAISNGTMNKGTVDDITNDYTQNPDTFYGNYGKIIGNIKAHAPNAMIVLLSIARPTERQLDADLKSIATKCGIPFIDLNDDKYFNSGVYFGSMSSNHPLAYGCSGIANAIQRLIEKCIENNPAYFGTYTAS